jgi:hypothetical protein
MPGSVKPGGLDVEPYRVEILILGAIACGLDSSHELANLGSSADDSTTGGSGCICSVLFFRPAFKWLCVILADSRSVLRHNRF